MFESSRRCLSPGGRPSYHQTCWVPQHGRDGRCFVGCGYARTVSFVRLEGKTWNAFVLLILWWGIAFMHFKFSEIVFTTAALYGLSSKTKRKAPSLIPFQMNWFPFDSNGLSNEQTFYTFLSRIVAWLSPFLGNICAWFSCLYFRQIVLRLWQQGGHGLDGWKSVWCGRQVRKTHQLLWIWSSRNASEHDGQWKQRCWTAMFWILLFWLSLWDFI